MPDPRFFDRAGPFPLALVAQRAGARLEGDPAMPIQDVAALGLATERDVAFFDNRRLRDALAATRAGALIVRDADRDLAPAGRALLISLEPYRSYAAVAALFYPSQERRAAGVHAGAHVDPTAKLGDRVHVAAGAVVEAGAEIGDGCRIAANAVLGERCILGPDCVVGAGASLSHCLIGARTVIHAGVRIGQDGFGYALGFAHGKVPQLGRVLIGDDVEIGANTTIDRGALGDTVIGSGTKIDNLVQIAHNVVLGEHCVIVAQSGISGSAELGHHVVVAAQSGITGHLTIGPGARLAARTAVIRDLEGNQDYGGAPAIPAKEWRRQLVAIGRLGRRN
ncbi:MAG: UDP-3-O-(3-hydroxymyristoyl)glucosamine N-acyltransferase [Geminicoccaceae bacterium]|nr:MAG: UDP-3-O-(3-hydroxymyristoyl)glucosamine N-acyltransferase [Geminicoccaceae bacterium]